MMGITCGAISWLGTLRSYPQVADSSKRFSPQEALPSKALSSQRYWEDAVVFHSRYKNNKRFI